MKKFLIIVLILVLSPLSTYADLRWEKTDFTVYITQNPKMYIMKKAFGRWQSATNRFVTFKFVDNPNNADMSADFVEQLPGQAVGICRTEYKTLAGEPVEILKADIQLANKNLYKRILTDDEYYRVMLHEIGHALGLPHSEKLNSIMKQYSNEIINISIDDRKALKELYKK